MRALDHAQVDRYAVDQGGLYSFIRLAWHVVEGGVRFVPGWHLEEIAYHLEAVTRGECKQLVINIPPGLSKSTSVSVFWPAWEWGPAQHPETRFMAASFDASLSQRDALRSKELMLSPWYQQRWGATSGVPKPVILTADDKAVRHKRQDSGGIFWTTAGGFRFSTSVGGKATGWHAHRQIIDDPVKPMDLERGAELGRAALDKSEAWYDGTMSTRKLDPSNFSRVIIMQRLAVGDLAGIAIERGYHALILPMEYNPKRSCVTPWGGDRRTEEGELLCPERFDRASVAQLRKDLGARKAAAQLDQNPTPDDGSTYKRAWFQQTFAQVPAGASWMLSLDAAFKDGNDNDFVVFQVWAQAQRKMYLVEQVRDKMDFPTTLAAAQRLIRKYPELRQILIEDKANGSGIIQTLRKTTAGVIAYKPDVSKEARASAASPYWEAGDIFLPDEPWVADFVEEHVRFPLGKHDDQVDAANQAILRMTGRQRPRAVTALERAMGKL